MKNIQTIIGGVICALTISISVPAFGQSSPQYSPEKYAALSAVVPETTFPQIVPTMNHGYNVMNAWFSPYETQILTEGWRHKTKDFTLKLWDADTGEQIGATMRHGGNIYGAVFTEDNKRILSWGEDGFLRLWDTRTGKQVELSMNHGGLIRGAKFSKDEKFILSNSTWAGSARVWDGRTGAKIGREVRHSSFVLGADFSKDESRVLSWSQIYVRLSDTKTGKRLWPKIKHDESVSKAQFYKNETRIMTQGVRSIKFWNAKTGLKAAPTIKLNVSSIRTAEFIEDEKRLFIVSNSHASAYAAVFDLRTGKRISERLGYLGRYRGSKLTSDEKRVLLWGSTGTMSLRDIYTGKDIVPPMHHGGDIFRAYFSPDESLIVTSNSDDTAKLWITKTGKQIGQTFPGTARFSEDGQRLLTWADDGAVQVWDISAALK